VHERTTPPPSPSIDGDGVRVVRPHAGRPRWLVAAVLGTLAIGLATAWVLHRPATDIALTPRTTAGAAAMQSTPPLATTVSPTTAPVRRAATRDPSTSTPTTMQIPADWPSGDPRDLASHFRPGDPEPTAGEVIRALQEGGDFTGLGAFNPPGTSPPLHGLAVPPDFVLPPGYVRHHQVTDDGVPLEPILMFAPDLVMLDAAGQPIPLPDDRVVPPELAPPGLPIRTIEVPTP
jgi:hypothetical protein